MKKDKQTSKNASVKKQADFNEAKKTPKLKPTDKKSGKNWKNSLFSEDEEDETFIDPDFENDFIDDPEDDVFDETS